MAMSWMNAALADRIAQVSGQAAPTVAETRASLASRAAPAAARGTLATAAKIATPVAAVAATVNPWLDVANPNSSLRRTGDWAAQQAQIDTRKAVDAWNAGDYKGGVGGVLGASLMQLARVGREAVASTVAPLGFGFVRGNPAGTVVPASPAAAMAESEAPTGPAAPAGGSAAAAPAASRMSLEDYAANATRISPAQYELLAKTASKPIRGVDTNQQNYGALVAGMYQEELKNAKSQEDVLKAQTALMQRLSAVLGSDPMKLAATEDLYE